MNARVIIAMLCALAALLAGGCSDSLSDDEISKAVRTSMQRKLSSDESLKPLGLRVLEVKVMNKSGNEYKGMATVRTPSGTHRDIPVEVTTNGDGVMWETQPGAFLFALQENFPAYPPS